MSAEPHFHPRDEEAVDYVLHTLAPDERAAFEVAMAGDPELAAAVRHWQEVLAALTGSTPPVEPRVGLLARIERAISDHDEAMPRPGPTSDLADLRRSRSIWRAATAAATAMAAGLALFIAIDRVPVGGGSRELIAVVNRAGDLPALVVRVDATSGIVRVRAIAAETPAERSLELWSVASGSAPRSLGVVGAGLTRVTAKDRSDLRDGVTLAVTVEPPGGSTTGGPTGPVVYSGRLVPETP